MRFSDLTYIPSLSLSRRRECLSWRRGLPCDIHPPEYVRCAEAQPSDRRDCPEKCVALPLVNEQGTRYVLVQS
jgi:hypothetical protein